MLIKSLAARCQRFWRERVVALLITQLRQGVSPQKIALTIALGICLACFPIIGATSMLCLVTGLWLKLNQPVIQLVNWLASPLQLGLLLPLVRLGERLAGAQPVSFTIPEMFAKFQASPAKFLGEFGLTGVHGIIGWVTVAPLAGVLLYIFFLPVTNRLAIRRQSAVKN
jgi:uncharacterized protein (DUF2062 family)